MTHNNNYCEYINTKLYSKLLNRLNSHYFYLLLPIIHR